MNLGNTEGGGTHRSTWLLVWVVGAVVFFCSHKLKKRRRRKNPLFGAEMKNPGRFIYRENQDRNAREYGDVSGVCYLNFKNGVQCVCSKRKIICLMCFMCVNVCV